MSRISYVNGQYLPHPLATMHIDERGMHFSDGVYEVIFFINKQCIDLDAHIKRLDFSLRELALDWPITKTVLPHIINDVIDQNRVNTGAIYIQITRGTAPRSHAFPKDAAPSLIISTKRMPFSLNPQKLENASAIIVPDQRWKRPDIKTICLLPNALAKEQAQQTGAYEAIFKLDNGFISEGSSTNVWIVDKNGKVITPPAKGYILNGITRQTLLKLGSKAGLQMSEKEITETDLLKASEVFLSGTTTFVKPITHINNKAIGHGKPGPITAKIAELYYSYCMAESEHVRLETTHRLAS